MKYEVVMKGGVGNQLFILLEVYRLSLEKNVDIILNISKFTFDPREKRTFDLDYIHSSIYREFNIKKGIFSFFKFVLISFLEKIFNQNKSGFIEGDKTFSLKLPGGIILKSGYFQNINNSEIDQKALGLLKEKLKPFFAGKKINRLAVHIRRGDYLYKRYNLHGIIKQEILIKEAKKICDKYNLDGITIFTDSPELVKINEFKKIKEMVFIDKSINQCDALRKMSLHNALITSNSSFSLWAGLIGNPEIMRVPSEWFKNQKTDSLGISWIDRYQAKLI